MLKFFTSKIFLLVSLGIIFFFLILGVYFADKFYNDIFRLSSSQVSSSLIKKISQCKKITDCKLLSGDILIRRYITSKTWSFNKFARPYFTHSAFYLGNDKIVEAVGTEKDYKNEIQISAFSKSDWLDNSMENFVIVRPKYTIEKLDQVRINLITIANDPNYRFGLPQSGYKQTTCADLILEQLLNEQVTTIYNIPKITTPDYLFWLAINNPTHFEIIGYNISE